MSAKKFVNRFLINADKKISIALVAPFVVLIIQYLILVYFNLFESNYGSIIPLFSKGLVGVAFLYSIPVVTRRSLKKFVLVYFIAFFVFSSNYILFPENRQYIEGLLIQFFFVCLPVFLYTLSLNDFSVFKSIMLKASYIVFFVGLVIGTLVFTKKASIGTYSMPFSYYMLLPAIMFLDRLMDKFSVRMSVFSILSVVIILALGSRGPILCIVVFIVLKFFKPRQIITHRKIVCKFTLVAIGVIVLFYLKEIIMILDNFLMNFGVKSRTLSLFLNERGLYLSGRDEIYKKVLDEISINLLTGIGIAGDTRIIGKSYVHNFFIEVIGNFGIILGSIFIIGIILLIINSIISKDTIEYDIVIIWLSIGFVHLMLSSSYWIDFRFWAFLGILINLNRKKYFRKKLIVKSKLVCKLPWLSNGS